MWRNPKNSLASTVVRPASYMNSSLEALKSRELASSSRLGISFGYSGSHISLFARFAHILSLPGIRVCCHELASSVK